MQRKTHLVSAHLHTFKHLCINQGPAEDTSQLENEIDNLNTALQQEKAAHDATREELELVSKQLQTVKDELSALEGQSQVEVQKATAVLQASLASKEEVS